MRLCIPRPFEPGTGFYGVFTRDDGPGNTATGNVCYGHSQHLYPTT